MPLVLWRTCPRVTYFPPINQVFCTCYPDDVCAACSSPHAIPAVNDNDCRARARAAAKARAEAEGYDATAAARAEAEAEASCDNDGGRSNAEARAQAVAEARSNNDWDRKLMAGEGGLALPPLVVGDLSCLSPPGQVGMSFDDDAPQYSD